MNAWKRNSSSVLLMAGSLLLLLLFQIFWLINVYEKEKLSLVDEADDVFLKAVRIVEDSFFKSLVFPVEKLDSIKLKSDSIKVNVDFQKNTSYKVLFDTIVDYTATKQIENSAVIQLDFRTDLHAGKDNPNFGSLAFAMASQKHAPYIVDTSFSISDTSFSYAGLDLIRRELNNILPSTTFPSEYKVVVLANEEETKSGLLSNTHKDIVSKRIFAIHFPHYKSHILKKITPQIFFSFFLFSCIALSFFMVWKSLEKQRRLTELKNDFISNITHELKTPITTVGVALEALSNFNALQNPERTEEYLNISKHELSRLSILVDKVLKMSMFEKKEPELKIEMLDMQSMVQEVLSSMKLQFEKATAQVNFQTKGNAFFLQGDKIHLTSVVYNLVDNALKYSPSNPVINLLLENTNDQVQLTVADQGIGISNDDQDKIFEKFFRVPQGDQHNVKGYGLGLSYVASVIKKHQGDIAVKSQLNKGTSFIISLPNKR